MANELKQPEDDVRDLVTPADNAEPTVERVETRTEQPVAEKKEAEKPKVSSPFEEHRQSAIEKYRAQRDGTPQTLPEEIERSRVGDKVETRADREARKTADTSPVEEAIATPAEASRPAEQEPVVVKRKLKVNGKEIEITEDELVRKAQIALAADDVLENAKAIKADLLEKLDELERHQAHQSQPPAQKAQSQQPASEDTKPDDEELDEIIDQIQVGDRKDAAAALAKALKTYGDRVETRILERLGDIDERIVNTTRVQAENDRLQRATKDTWDTFVNDEPAFRESKALQAALSTEILDQMESELFKLGVEEATLRRAQEQRGMSRTETVGTAYRELKDKFGLPAPSEIMKRSATNIRTAFKLPEPANTQRQPVQTPSYDPTERIERKRVLPQQPSRANVSPGTEAAPMSREEKMRQAVQQRRAYTRGR